MNCFEESIQFDWITSIYTWHMSFMTYFFFYNGHWQTSSQDTVLEAADLCKGIHFQGNGVGSNRSMERYPFPWARCRKQEIYAEVSISQGTVSEATDLCRGIHFPGYGVESNRSMQRHPFPHLPRYDVDGSRTACGIIHHATQVCYPGDGQDCDGSCLEQLFPTWLFCPKSFCLVFDRSLRTIVCWDLILFSVQL